VPKTLALAAVALALVAGACGGGGKSTKSAALTTQAPPSTAATTSTTTVESKILADLAAYKDSYHQALASPDQAHIDLMDHMIGGVSGVTFGYLAQLKDAHQAIRGPITDKSVRVASIQGTTAVVESCSDNESHTYRNGVQLPDTPGDRVLGSEFTMVLQNGTWKVSNVVPKASVCSG
jgi:hypothetical protein